MHLSTSISTGKAPMDLAALRIALARQSNDLLPQMLMIFDTFGQTIAFKNANFNFGHIQPTSMFGRGVNLQALPDPQGFFRGKGLVETRH